MKRLLWLAVVFGACSSEGSVDVDACTPCPALYVTRIGAEGVCYCAPLDEFEAWRRLPAPPAFEGDAGVFDSDGGAP